jgi:FAD synthetase
MSAEQLAVKYISSAERALKELHVRKDKLRIDSDKIKETVNYAGDYLEDAKYYNGKKEFEVSLTSVAYCEGLLDALKMLGAVSFEWTPSKRKTPRTKH